MSKVTLGRISSMPDKDGRHKLKCPKCQTDFTSRVMQEDGGEFHGISCPHCSHKSTPLDFVSEANKDEAMDLVKNYVDTELKKAFKNVRLK